MSKSYPWRESSMEPWNGSDKTDSSEETIGEEPFDQEQRSSSSTIGGYEVEPNRQFQNEISQGTSHQTMVNHPVICKQGGMAQHLPGENDQDEQYGLYAIEEYKRNPCQPYYVQGFRTEIPPTNDLSAGDKPNTNNNRGGRMRDRNKRGGKTNRGEADESKREKPKGRKRDGDRGSGMKDKPPK